MIFKQACPLLVDEASTHTNKFLNTRTPYTSIAKLPPLLITTHTPSLPQRVMRHSRQPSVNTYFKSFVSLLHRPAIGLKHFSTVEFVFHKLSKRESVWERCCAGFCHSRNWRARAVRWRCLSTVQVLEEVLGAQCVYWRKSCCPSCASCCGGLEVRKCGRDKQKDEMADQMTDYFHAQNDDAAVLSR